MATTVKMPKKHPRRVSISLLMENPQFGHGFLLRSRSAVDGVQHGNQSISTLLNAFTFLRILGMGNEKTKSTRENMTFQLTRSAQRPLAHTAFITRRTCRMAYSRATATMLFHREEK